jgi:hypothetical protein
MVSQQYTSQSVFGFFLFIVEPVLYIAWVVGIGASVWLQRHRLAQPGSHLGLTVGGSIALRASVALAAIVAGHILSLSMTPSS